VLEGRSKNGFLGYGLTAVGEIGFKAPFFTELWKTHLEPHYS
jgi:hypothetical protein